MWERMTEANRGKHNSCGGCGRRSSRGRDNEGGDNEGTKLIIELKGGATGVGAVGRVGAGTMGVGAVGTGLEQYQWGQELGVGR